jgi:NTP pyrophosphatase (non-canonical NTP hydrolase)
MPERISKWPKLKQLQAIQNDPATINKGLPSRARMGTLAARHQCRKPIACRGIMLAMSPHEIDNLDTLRLRIREFARVRAWERYHTPKNLVMALSVEAAELLEPFQWLTAEQSQHLSAEQHAAVRHEIADVLIYLTRLADLLDIDLLDAAADKLALNARKYPVEKAHGNALKYSDFSDD